MSNINWSDVVERVLWTAAQAFLGAFSSTIVFSDLESVQAAAFAGFAAAAAAVLSLLKNVVRQQVTE